ncbi:uncharacterized protein LOC117566641 isoform X3 [Drosophila albomicans]|uniref:Uncharacterized protein LOC117566641 isoform X3 n=1 Tax=Drosophila albomicans TaxID=7291 RepID=A0A9C6SSN5_DROAB|nr:uncharacterized protein LOC117566641 isoform X3 [Drosophila albomicans]
MAVAATATTNATSICVSCVRQRQNRRCVGVGVGSGATAAIGSNAILQIYSAWALLTLLAASAAIVQSAAVFGGLSQHTFKPLCSAQHEHFMESDGKESSLIIELKPDSYGAEHSTCTRILSAPPSFGFIVRLILPKLRHNQHTTDNDNYNSNSNSNNDNTQSLSSGSFVSSIMPSVVSTARPQSLSSGSSALTGMSTLIERLNTTAAAAAAAGAEGGLTSAATIAGRTCPLNIFSSLDPHTAQWRVDPCQLEDTASEMEDPVRLFHGRVRIVWEHEQQELKSKLMITVLGKGEQCKDAQNKHQCLKIGDEPILCISKELACDGIRHCPYSNEYDSDEDYELCYKQRRPGLLPSAKESDLIEQFTLEVFRNFFLHDAPKRPQNASSSVSNSNSTTQLHKVHTKDMKKPNGEANGSPNAIGAEQTPEADGKSGQDNATMESNGNANANANGNGNTGGSGFTRRNSTRTGLHSDLSKYGPWGYLMLGMLLCGGALLICGLWGTFNCTLL